MGAKTINWCDRCGTKNPQTLRGFWFGSPSEFHGRHHELKRPSNKNQVSLCENCLDYVESEVKMWGVYRNE